MNTFIDIEVFFDDENFTELFGVYLAERPLIPVAEQIYETINVPGRQTGELTRKLGFASKPFSLAFRFIHKVNVKQKAREIVNWLYHKTKIHFSDDDTVHRIIQQINFDDMTNVVDCKADFVLRLVTEPFWYHEDEIVTILSSSGYDVIENPSNIEIDARMRIWGSGDCMVTVNNKQIKLYGVDEFVWIWDKNAFKDEEDWNNKMEGNYPIFTAGENVIQLSEGTTKVDIFVRWAFR